MKKDLKKKKIRSSLQNRALHKYFSLLGEILNDAGYDMKKVLKPEVDIPWDKDSVKRFLWKPVQKVIVGHNKTRKLKTDEVNKVFNVVNRFIAKHKVHVPWPSITEIINRLRKEDEQINKIKRISKKRNR